MPAALEEGLETEDALEPLITRAWLTLSTDQDPTAIVKVSRGLARRTVGEYLGPPSPIPPFTGRDLILERPESSADEINLSC